MQESHERKNKKLPIFFLVIISAVVIIVGIGFLLQGRIQTVIANIETNLENRGKAAFTVDSAKLSGWWTAGNTWPNAKDFTGDQSEKDNLPVASISIHQCKLASQCEDPEKDTLGGHCFVMLSYQNQSINPETAVAEKIKYSGSFGDMTIREVGVKTLTMNTPEGDMEYQLHEYDYESKGGNAILRGNALGYVSLSDGHIQVQSVCADASQLGETLPVLQAVDLAK